MNRVQAAICEITGKPAKPELRENKLGFLTAIKPTDVLLLGVNDDEVLYANVSWTAALSGSNHSIREVAIEVTAIDLAYEAEGQDYKLSYPSPGWTVELEDISDGLPLRPNWLTVDSAKKLITVQFEQRTTR